MELLLALFPSYVWLVGRLIVLAYQLNSTPFTRANEMVTEKGWAGAREGWGKAGEVLRSADLKETLSFYSVQNKHSLSILFKTHPMKTHHFPPTNSHVPLCSLYILNLEEERERAMGATGQQSNGGEVFGGLR